MMDDTITTLLRKVASGKVSVEDAREALEDASLTEDQMQSAIDHGVFNIAESGTTGFELRSGAPASIGINAGTASNAESAIAGTTTLVRCICVSATNWVATQFDGDGDESKVEAAA